VPLVSLWWWGDKERLVVFVGLDGIVNQVQLQVQAVFMCRLLLLLLLLWEGGGPESSIVGTQRAIEALKCLLQEQLNNRPLENNHTN
jgi:hypothetical protein